MKLPDTRFNLSLLAEVYDELPLWAASFGLKLLENIHFRPGIRALDIGFGTGFPLIELAMRSGSDSIIYGIDPWKEGHDRAKKKIDYYGITHIRLIQGVAESIPLPDGSLDLIVSNNGINNVQDRGQVFSECQRLLKPGGVLTFTMNTDLSLFEFYQEFENVLNSMNLTDTVKMMKQHIQDKRPALDTILSQLKDKGFRIAAVDSDQFYYHFANTRALFNHYFFRLSFLSRWIELVPPDMQETVFSKIADNLDRLPEYSNGLRISIPFVLVRAIRIGEYS
jgi:ubiquinone/menaquinone biosynthesis C-methylase UbiE